MAMTGYSVKVTLLHKGFFRFNNTVERFLFFDEPKDTYTKRAIPVLAMAKERPRMPLPTIALLRLNTDIPKEVVPGCWEKGDR